MSQNTSDIKPPSPVVATAGLAAPFLHASETARSIFLIIFMAACGPLLAGIAIFGWRVAMLAAISIASCAAIERLCYRVSKMPSLAGRTHACLTGLLLALTLPPFAPWYVPVIASAFAIIVGKAIFGGVGHFLWQPALVGRLAVAVLFASTLNPDQWSVLAQDKLIVGDVQNCRRAQGYQQWRGQAAPRGADGFLLAPPRQLLAGLTDHEAPAYWAINEVSEDASTPAPSALLPLPPINDLLYGAYGGEAGATCSLVIVMAGLYLVYRNYVKWQLPVMFILSAAAVAAVGPVFLAGPHQTVETTWLPVWAEGLDVGFIYVMYQLLSGPLLLAAFFLASEMTSRPVTSGGQAIFGVGCGVLAMLLQLYTPIAIPAYMAVLAMNTLTPAIDRLGWPAVLGRRRRLWARFGNGGRP